MRPMFAALAATAILFAAACDEHAPVLPTAPLPPGVSNVVITVTADRVTLNAGSTVPATITISARLQDGSAVPDGSELAINTNLGYFTDSGGSAVQLISAKTAGGAATVKFFAGNDVGSASLLAQFGTSVGKMTVTVVAAPIAPVADFSADVAGLRAIFTNLSTGTAPTYEWKFGDTSSASAAVSPIYDYDQPGTYTVTLTATNDAGSSVKSKFVTVAPPPPLVASFTSQVSGLSVAFMDTSAGSPTAWLWSFGDGKTSTLQHPQHTFPSGGTYGVTLQISRGDQSTAVTNFISVGGLPPSADFSFEVAGLSALFTDQSLGSPTSWKWYFGDDTAIDARQNPGHVYEEPGTYTVSLTVENLAGTSTKSQFVTVTLGDAPKAAFTAQVIGLDVAFTDASTGAPTSWEWNFGDNTALDTRQNPTHHYATAGTYTVTLKAENAGGSSTVSQLLQVVGAPGAAFTISYGSQDTLTVNFRDRSTGSPTSWQWSFGDCSAQAVCTSAVQNPTHTYVEPGSYTVLLTVANSAGQSTTQSTVKAGLPQASFTYDKEGLQVTFTDQSTNSPTDYFWTFGDCNDASCSSTDQNPIHTYPAAGTYTVNLTVVNAAGQSSTSRLVTVP